MYNGSETFSDTMGNGAAWERIKILALCLAGANELGGRLEAVLHRAENVELVLEHYPDEPSINHRSLVSRLFAKFLPNLLLLCLPRGGTTRSEAVFEAVRKNQRELSIVVILETPDPNELHRFLSLGAVDFCLAPLRLEDLLPRLMRWSFSIPKTNALARQLEQSLGLQQMLGESRVFLEALHKIPKLARCSASVLITGETGTGKEMCARAIHQLGPRADHPFVPVNCGAIPSELVENELFGHVAGAFTGAFSAVRGLFHDAEGGTLFLDEIDSLPLPTQVKFLRFLQDQEYRPLGARKTCQANIRVIAASNADLKEAVRSGRFRADLFYRLNILPLELPALRERREDILLLARHFVVKYAREFALPVKELSRNAREKLLAYAWPGNVRELENVIERALVLSEQPLIIGEDICVPGVSDSEETSFKALKEQAIADFETAYVRRLLVLHDGNISQAARAAKKNRRAFWQLMRKHDIAVSAAARIR
jgi:two-component system response regulator GlrR